MTHRLCKDVVQQQKITVCNEMTEPSDHTLNRKCGNMFKIRAWGSAALLVGRSRDRSPVVSLGIFSEASDKSMCPGTTQPLKRSTR